MQTWQKIHIVGIEGAGTSALAQLYVAAGHTVSGSDDGDGFYRAQLQSLGVTLFPDFDAAHVPADADTVMHSTAFGEDNPEIARARELGLAVLSYPEAVAELFNTSMGIAVCGTHGKTTTTAMTTALLAACGKDPRAIVGSQIVGWRGNARAGSGDVMVLEADEYQNKLRYYAPFGVILTSIDYDHPDFFPTPDAYAQAFADFVARIPKHGVLVAYGDDADVRMVAQHAHCRVIFYGTRTDNDVVLEAIATKTAPDAHGVPRPTTTFRLRTRDDAHAFTLHVPGAHNALNAAAALTMARHLGCADTDALADALAAFRGARRRFEIYGLYRGALLLDDYAHHPAELRATLAAARAAYPDRRIIAAFHPHTFTLTKALLTEFAQSFDDADRVLVLDIYGSARETHGGVTAQDLVTAINRIHPERAQHIGTIEALADYARENLTDRDLFLTLGAGDVYKALHMLRSPQSSGV